ncbi:MAG TPA: hypothetical protein DDZ78_17075 [Porphyromonadaceae bacterium]|nr:hypothetical protein [Porphyromonadaceae bacterium]
MTMESRTIYPKDKKQKSLLTALLEEMRVDFEVRTSRDDSLLTEEAFYAKIEKSIQQAESRKLKTLTKDKQKEFLGL